VKVESDGVDAACADAASVRELVEWLAR